MFEGLLVEHCEEVHCSRVQGRVEQGGEGGVPWLGKLRRVSGTSGLVVYFFYCWDRGGCIVLDLGLSRTHSNGVRAMKIRDMDQYEILRETKSDGNYEKDLHRQTELALVHVLVYDSMKVCETGNF